MPDPIWTYIALCLSAFFAGAMNSIAGGGTLLTFPALMTAFAPLGSEVAATMANGTSTVALLPGSFAGAVGYRKELRECLRFVVRMFVPSLAGGFLGFENRCVAIAAGHELIDHGKLQKFGQRYGQ